MERKERLEARIPARLGRAELRRFGLTLGAAFLVLGGIAWWRDHLPVAIALGSLGGTLALAGVIVPAWLSPVERGWMAFAHAISKVTTPIFMGIVYFGVITPIGLISRKLGKDPLAPHDSGGGFWVSRDIEAGQRGDMKRQF